MYRQFRVWGLGVNPAASPVGREAGRAGVSWMMANLNCHGAGLWFMPPRDVGHIELSVSWSLSSRKKEAVARTLKDRSGNNASICKQCVKVYPDDVTIV